MRFIPSVEMARIGRILARSNKESKNDRYLSKLFFIILLFILGCGSSTAEIKKPETISATVETSSNSTAAPAEEKTTLNVEYQNPIDVIDPKEVFGSYLAQDSVWVEKHQLFINQNFDFAIAMSIPDIGAGLAAKKRQEANKKASEQLTSIPAVNLKETFERSVAEYQDIQREPIRVRVVLYGLLFGDKKARLQSVLELTALTEDKDTKERPTLRFVTVSEVKPLSGDGSWSSDNGSALIDAIRIGTEQLVSLFYEYRKSEDELLSSKAEGKPSAKCPVGGNQKVEGKLVAKKGSRTILRLDRRHPTLLSCESETLLQ